MKQITDVWTLETADEEFASHDLNYMVDKALTFQGVSERAYLRKLWDGESWKSIKQKLLTEGSVWYVWYMDGVRQHLVNIVGLAYEISLIERSSKDGRAEDNISNQSTT